MGLDKIQPTNRFEEELREAAGIYECDQQHPERKFDENGYKYRDFQAGARWALQSQLVKSMAEALEDAKEAYEESYDPDADEFSADWYTTLASALAAYLAECSDEPLFCDDCGNETEFVYVGIAKIICVDCLEKKPPHAEGEDE